MDGLVPGLTFALSAGVATFFAPCAFPLLPGYLGFYFRHRKDGGTGLLAAGTAAGGALLSLGVVSSLAFVLGHSFLTALPLFEPILGVGLVVVGLWTVLGGGGPSVGVLLPARPNSLFGLGVFGAGYALAAAGCVTPLFLGVLGQAVTLSEFGGLLVLVTYACAVAAPLLGVTLLANLGLDEWRRVGRYGGRLERVAGGLMIVAGVGQLYLSVVVLDVIP